MLNVSCRIADIRAFRSICSSVIRRRIFATLRAGNVKRGRAAIASSVSRQSARSITTRMTATETMLENTVTKVPVIACCAPTTSVLTREISSPVLVAVKNRSDILCKCS